MTNLTRVQRAQQYEQGNNIICRSRYGRKLHKSSRGSSTTHCGLWLRASAVHFRVAANLLKEKHDDLLCEHCFGPRRQAPRGER